MQKDVIYIDTEDDITAIIGKVKVLMRKKWTGLFNNCL